MLAPALFSQQLSCVEPESGDTAEQEACLLLEDAATLALGKTSESDNTVKVNCNMKRRQDSGSTSRIVLTVID